MSPRKFHTIMQVSHKLGRAEAALVDSLYKEGWKYPKSREEVSLYASAWLKSGGAVWRRSNRKAIGGFEYGPKEQ